MAHLQSEQLKGKKQETHIRTKRMKRETRRRNNQMDDFMHKKSRKIVDTCMEENVEVIVDRKQYGLETEHQSRQEKQSEFCTDAISEIHQNDQV